jgi:hypothetical protein
MARIYTADHVDVVMAKLLCETMSQDEIAETMGINRSKVQRLLRVPDAPPPAPTLPVFPDEDIEAEEILDHMEHRFEKRLEHDAAVKWFSIRMPTNEPMGLTFVGDPHIGDNGCNIKLLREDCHTMATVPGIQAVNLGDTANNWGGYLVKLYAEQDTSRETERRLARWFLEESGVPWVIWLMGNHEMMDSEFGTYLKTLNAHQIPMLDWRAQFKLVFPNKKEARIDAAHNHKGTSIYNKLHGQKRAALWEENADVYVAGHHHNCAITQEELDDGRWVTMMRARGYKWIDAWAAIHQFRDNRHGASIMLVIDPKAESQTEFIHPFADIKTGARYLTYLRSK